MANTTWSATDKAAGVILSGGNLTATNVGGAAGAVRSVHAILTGKYYWEYLWTTTSGAVTGIANGTADIAGGGVVTTVVGASVVNQNGIIGVNSSTQLATLGTISAGSTICLAVDMDAKLIWYRNGAAGNWNGSASNNPATGVGGLSIAAIAGGALSIHALYGDTGSSGNVTANFGAGAFVGAVPAGFTSGLSDSVTAVSYEVATQVSAEHWARNAAPALQATQVLTEQWASANATPPQMAVSQVLLEQWATVAVASASGQARAWILA